ncbi:MAG: methyltransferase domain-containing protein, partial [Armatimonadetes bacterium]|nr:methyltransferase domain-containing protein [Armatimonadota bacterium]
SFSTPARRPYEDVVCWNEFAWSGEAAGPPASWHPRQWTVSQLQEYVNYSVRAKSPSTAFYRPFMKGEFEAEMASVPVMAGRTVVFAPFSGNHMFELHRRGKFQGTVEAVVLAPEIARFLQEKRGDMGSDLDVHYSVYEGGRLPLEDASVDNVFCAHHLEHFADPGPIVEEMRRVLKPDGRLVLLFSNACSPYYLLWRVDKHRSNPSAGLRGPFCPITPFAVRRLLRRGFRYERAVGVTPLPYGRFQSVRWRGLLRYVCKGWVSLWTKRG